MELSKSDVYLRELAHPMYDRFSAEPTSYEPAITCCILIFHFADVVAFDQEGLTPKAAADKIKLQIPKFDTVQAIANAGKHVELTRHPNKALNGLRAEHLEKGRGSAFDDGAFFSDGTTWSDVPETIVLETPDGVKHDVLYVCKIVLTALETFKVNTSV